jgi:hypothetical protein
MHPRRRQRISQGDRSNSGIPRPTPGAEVSDGAATCSPSNPQIILQSRGSKGRPSKRLRRIKYACGDNIGLRHSSKIFAQPRAKLPPFRKLLPGPRPAPSSSPRWEVPRALSGKRRLASVGVLEHRKSNIESLLCSSAMSLWESISSGGRGPAGHVSWRNMILAFLPASERAETIASESLVGKCSSLLEGSPQGYEPATTLIRRSTYF